jgi:putative colanic acid biosynthesis glycosyltransferase
MPKLLQINIVSNMLSTGKICEDIAKVATSNGWECFIAYGRWAKPGISISKRVGGQFDMYEHFIEHKLFDNEGLASRSATRKLISWIEQVNPDLIQIHNIHDHYLNYSILFKYFSILDKPIVWVQHDCWSFTGGCAYFDLYKCKKWMAGCVGVCPNKRALFRNRSEIHYKLKKLLTDNIKNLVFVSVSEWLAGLLKQSIHKERCIVTIHNGIDLDIFKYKEKDTSPYKKFKILGVAAVWDSRKGLDDFFLLRTLLPLNYEICLVGLTSEQIKKLPKGINGISRTNSVNELVQLYSNSDVFVNPTYSDNFPTTNLEALACGTPVITYNTGGSPEAIDDKTGYVIEQGDVTSIANTIVNMKKHPFSSYECRKRAEANFNKDNCFAQYITLFNKLLK